MKIVWTAFLLTFSTLLPLVNPFGSALVFLELVGTAPPELYRKLARRIALDNFIFLFIIEMLGAAILRFFGISLPIVQVSGGLVIAFMGWSSLNDKDTATTSVVAEESEVSHAQPAKPGILNNAFYPLTFPVTSGPGTLVALLTLTAHISSHDLTHDILGHIGILGAAGMLSGIVYVCYASAPRITSVMSESTSIGILRVVSFIMLCIGAQIAWNGFSSLLRVAIHN